MVILLSILGTIVVGVIVLGVFVYRAIRAVDQNPHGAPPDQDWEEGLDD